MLDLVKYKITLLDNQQFIKNKLHIKQSTSWFYLITLDTLTTLSDEMKNIYLMFITEFAKTHSLFCSNSYQTLPKLDISYLTKIVLTTEKEIFTVENLYTICETLLVKDQQFLPASIKHELKKRRANKTNRTPHKLNTRKYLFNDFDLKLLSNDLKTLKVSTTHIQKMLDQASKAGIRENIQEKYLDILTKNIPVTVSLLYTLSNSRLYNTKYNILRMSSLITIAEKHSILIPYEILESSSTDIPFIPVLPYNNENNSKYMARLYFVIEVCNVSTEPEHLLFLTNILNIIDQKLLKQTLNVKVQNTNKLLKLLK